MAASYSPDGKSPGNELLHDRNTCRPLPFSSRFFTLAMHVHLSDASAGYHGAVAVAAAGWAQESVVPAPSALPPIEQVVPTLPPGTEAVPTVPSVAAPPPADTAVSPAMPGVEAPSAPASPGTRRLNIHAREVKLSPDAGVYQFIGDVRLETDGLVVSAAEVTYTEQTQDAVARGNVSVRTPDGNVYWGNVLELHVPTRAWRFLEWSVEYPPAFLGQQFIGPVFVGGHEVTGLPDRLRARDSTCHHLRFTGAPLPACGGRGGDHPR